MTSPAEPASTPDASQAAQLTSPLREPVALALLGANAVLLFVGLVRFLVPLASYSTVTSRAGEGFGYFVGTATIVLPLLAFMLATHVQPTVPKAKLITQVALIEYAVSAVLGLLSLLIAVVGGLAEGQIGQSLLFLLSSAAYLAALGVVALVVHKVWRAVYHVPKPKPQPGVYGQPQPGWPQQPQGWPGQPGQPGQYGQPVQYGQPGQPGQYGAQPGYPAPPYGGAPASAPPFGGAPQSAPPFGSAPASAPPFGGIPQSAPPFGAPPQSAPPQSAPPFGQPPAPPAGSPFGTAAPAAPSFGGPPTAPPFGQPPSADPTQAIPRQSGGQSAPVTPRDDEGDRTQVVSRDDDNDRTQHVNPPDPTR